MLHLSSFFEQRALLNSKRAWEKSVGSLRNVRTRTWLYIQQNKQFSLTFLRFIRLTYISSVDGALSLNKKSVWIYWRPPLNSLSKFSICICHALFAQLLSSISITLPFLKLHWNIQAFKLFSCLVVTSNGHRNMQCLKHYHLS